VQIFHGLRQLRKNAERTTHTAKKLCCGCPANSPAPANGIWYTELSPDRHPNVIGGQFSWFAGIDPLPAPSKGPRLRLTTSAGGVFRPNPKSMARKNEAIPGGGLKVLLRKP